MAGEDGEDGAEATGDRDVPGERDAIDDPDANAATGESDDGAGGRDVERDAAPADGEGQDPDAEPLGGVADAAARRGGDEPGNVVDDDSERTGGGGETADRVPRADAPLGDLASSLDRRRDRTPEGSEDDLFTREDVQEIDPDAVWDRLEGDEPVAPSDDEREVRVVEKDSYCERCPYFSPPPSVGCEHEGTVILELVDMDHFRVVDCPKVRETEQLEQL